MIVKAFVNAEGLNKLVAGESTAAASRHDPSRNMLIEVLVDLHEFDVSPAVDATQAIGHFTFTRKKSRHCFGDDDKPAKKVEASGSSSAAVPAQPIVPKSVTTLS